MAKPAHMQAAFEAYSYTTKRGIKPSVAQTFSNVQTKPKQC